MSIDIESRHRPFTFIRRSIGLILLSVIANNILIVLTPTLKSFKVFLLVNLDDITSFLQLTKPHPDDSTWRLEPMALIGP